MTNAELMTNEQTTFFRQTALVILSSLKKYRPPRPIGVKGGCSPQNNREKL
jgi:hypothetical protein